MSLSMNFIVPTFNEFKDPTEVKLELRTLDDKVSPVNVFASCVCGPPEIETISSIASLTFTDTNPELVLSYLISDASSCTPILTIAMYNISFISYLSPVYFFYENN